MVNVELNVTPVSWNDYCHASERIDGKSILTVGFSLVTLQWKTFIKSI